MKINHEMKVKCKELGLADINYWIYVEYKSEYYPDFQNIVQSHLDEKNYPKTLTFFDKLVSNTGEIQTSFSDQNLAFDYRDWLLENHREKLIALNYFSKHNSMIYEDFPKDQEDEEYYIERI